MSLLHIQTDCCRYPYILIPSGTNREFLQTKADRIHDGVHHTSQKRIGLLRWTWKYYTDYSFRWEEEQLAFTAEIIFYKSRNCYIFHDAFVNILFYGFLNMCTMKEAKKFISKF